ncbi:MAG: cobalamin biosynthesis protein [Actinoplanes sp.]
MTYVAPPAPIGGGGAAARRDLVVGVGARRGVPAEVLLAALTEALSEAGRSLAEVTVLATLDRRAAEEGVQAVAADLGWRLVAFDAAELAAQPVPHPSTVADAAVGTPSVAEAAALLAAGPGSELVLPKRDFPTVTIAVAAQGSSQPAQLH